jgi:hypothetical protein
MALLRASCSVASSDLSSFVSIQGGSREVKSRQILLSAVGKGPKGAWISQKTGEHEMQASTCYESAHFNGSQLSWTGRPIFCHHDAGWRGRLHNDASGEVEVSHTIACIHGSPMALPATCWRESILNRGYVGLEHIILKWLVMLM